MDKIYTAIGLMSGTSLDGIDAAIIRTNGHDVELTDSCYHLRYSDVFRAKLYHAIETKKVDDNLVVELTKYHSEIVNLLLDKYNINHYSIDIIGFHGQTIDHRPEDGFTWQVGDGELLAKLTGICVVNDFRSADVKAGGQGAPLVPIFHQAIMKSQPQPVAILNLGGVGNLTYINHDELLAFDTGAANALINDVVFAHTGQKYDDGGKIAVTGQVNEVVLGQLLADEYFTRPAPKSLDRDYFKQHEALWNRLEFADAVATLTAFTAKSVAFSIEQLSEIPEHIYVAGGGVYNQQMMRLIADFTAGTEFSDISKIGINPDYVEAQAFAYLAVRSWLNLPLTFPSTTACPFPQTGGVLCRY